MAWDLPRPDIRTPRLVLRRVRHGDEDPVFALFNNWEVARWLSMPPWPYTRADAEGFIRRTATEPHAEGADIAFAIDLDAALIGIIGVRIRPASHLQRSAGPNIGYWIGQPYWGHGYMTEAAAGLIRLVFAATSCDAIYSGAFVGNDASLRVQEKLGFVRDGETVLHSNPRGGDFPHINTVLTRARFATLST
jgi:RimJ/RimL family protein N-acetyltransferase